MEMPTPQIARLHAQRHRSRVRISESWTLDLLSGVGGRYVNGLKAYFSLPRRAERPGVSCGVRGGAPDEKKNDAIFDSRKSHTILHFYQQRGPGVPILYIRRQLKAAAGGGRALRRSTRATCAPSQQPQGQAEHRGRGGGSRAPLQRRRAKTIRQARDEIRRRRDKR